MKNMKRTLLIMLLACCGSAVAQVSVNYGALEKKVAKSDATIADPKKSLKDATWLGRAELMFEVFNSQILNAYRGMTPENFNIIIGKPKSQSNIDVEGVSTDRYTMDRVEFYFVERSLEYWKVTQPVIKDASPLDIARQSLEKAIELDAAGKKAKKIGDNLRTLKKLYLDESLNYYSLKDYANAYKSFKSCLEVGQMPQVNSVDTAVFYYAGLSAQLGGMYSEAISMYKQGLAVGFSSEGSAYFNMYEAYKAMGQNDEGVKCLEEGLVNYPQNLNILYSLINCYLEKGEDPSKIIFYIDKALVDAPDNVSLLFAKGTLYDKLEQYDEAVAVYTKATEVKPDFFDAYYNIGAVYYNKGVKLVEQANKVPASKVKEYEELVNQATAEFKKSIPYMEKAAEVNPQSKEAIEAVANLYFRFRNESPEMLEKYNQFKAKLDELRQQ
ncbi:MAG: tetratricopeptide repeat protein [Bacteroidales bacterium]|nr:tetratricopeptide repeat protein [Bacteroidales bacterium]